MEYTLEVIVFFILLLDSLSAAFLAWVDQKNHKRWYHRNFRLLSRYFPLSKGWTTYYLILVLWMGVMLIRSGQLAIGL